MKFRILVEQDEYGMHVADCPDVFLRGEDAGRSNCKHKRCDKGYMESPKKHNEAVPPSIDKEMVEVPA